MSEPGELSAEARSLVEQGRDADGPSPVDKQRIKSRLVAELGAGAFVIAAAATALPAGLPPSTSAPALSSLARGAPAHSAAATGSWTRSLWKHGLVKAAAAAGAVSALYLGAVSWPHATPPRATDPRASVAAAPVAAHHDTPAVSPAPPAARATPPTAALAPPAATGQPAATTNVGARTSRAHAVRTQSTPGAAAARAHDALARSTPGSLVDAAGTSTLGAELSLLALAQRALHEHQPARALELAQQHAARFAHGNLGEERRGIEALAHCQLGESSHASVAAFLAQSASSPLAARVRKECTPP